MEEADILCDSLFCWMKNRKECAEELLELAEAATSVLSTPSVLPGHMVPLLVLATGGTADCGTSPMAEEGISSSTFNKATELIEEDEKVGTRIQKQLQDLKDMCGGTQLGDHADELDYKVFTQMMCALARRDNTDVPLDFLRGFNRAAFFRHLTPGGLDPPEASRFICPALNLDCVPVIKSILKVLDAIGLDRSLSNLIGMCEELVERKQISKASKFLRDSARDILEGQQELQQQLDAMHEIIQKLFQLFRMKNLIKNYSLSLTEDGQTIIDYIKETCTDNTVVSWLQESAHQIEFVNLLTFVKETLSQEEEEEEEEEEEVFKKKKLRRPGAEEEEDEEKVFKKMLRRPDGGHIDIVFVAHGRIVDQFMPAAYLVPTPNIRDTILYSPWNCSIDSYAAFGIAQGLIQVTNREFYNMKDRVYCDPYPLPQHWNSMRESLHNIPEILLSPVTPEEEAWNLFNFLLNNAGLFTEDRVIIPYLVPKDLVDAYGEIPLYILILATSIILWYFGKTATVHLAACLVHEGSPEEWETQYAYTLSDPVCMTMYLDDRYMNTSLLNALRSMFDRNGR